MEIAASNGAWVKKVRQHLQSWETDSPMCRLLRGYTEIAASTTSTMGSLAFCMTEHHEVLLRALGALVSSSRPWVIAVWWWWAWQTLGGMLGDVCKWDVFMAVG